MPTPQDGADCRKMHISELLGTSLKDNIMDKIAEIVMKSHEDIFVSELPSDDGQQTTIGFCTKEMQDASWRYGHGAILFIDLTFGTLSTNLLLTVIGHGLGKVYYES